jgi:hypothetical protein
VNDWGDISSEPNYGFDLEDVLTIDDFSIIVLASDKLCCLMIYFRFSSSSLRLDDIWLY